MAPRAVIVGSGTEIPPNRVTNDMLSRIMDTSDAWIRERSGVETRYYVDDGHRHLGPRRGRGPSRPWRRRGRATRTSTSSSSPP